MLAFKIQWAIILPLVMQLLTGHATAQTVARFVSNDATVFIPFPDTETAVLGFLDWKPTGNVRITVSPKTRRLILIGRRIGAAADTSISVDGANNLIDVHLFVDDVDVDQSASLTIFAYRSPGQNGYPLFGFKYGMSTLFPFYKAPTAPQVGLNFNVCGQAAVNATSTVAGSSIVVNTQAGPTAVSTGLNQIQAALSALNAQYSEDDFPSSQMSVSDSFWVGEYANLKPYWDARNHPERNSYERLREGLKGAVNVANNVKIPAPVSGTLQRLTLPECADSNGSALGDWIKAWETSALPSILAAAKQAMDQQRWQEALKFYSYLSKYKPIVDVGVGVSAEGLQTIDAAISDRARFGSIFRTTIPTNPQSFEFLSSGTVINDLVSLARAPAPTHITPRFSAVDGVRQKGSVQVDPSGNLIVTVLGTLLVDPAVVLATSRSEDVVSTNVNALEALDVAIDSAAWQEGTATAWRVGSDLSISLTMPRSRAALILHQMRSLTGIPVTLRIKRSAQQRDSFTEIQVIVRLQSHVGVLPMRLVNDQILNTSDETVSISFAVTQNNSGKQLLNKAISTCKIAAKASISLTECFGQAVTVADVVQFVFDTSAANDSIEAAYFDFIQNDLTLGVSVQCELPSVYTSSNQPFTKALLTITPINISNQSKLPSKVVDLRSCGPNGKRDLQWIKPNDANAWSFRVQGLVSYDTADFTIDQNYVGAVFSVTSDMLPGFN
ncbi:hypothetical protein UNDYM_2328 [Undibacterium sp. YM2]|uniref:hypothetical protein n=1 Tax=Undibacterium sp. YM2 TaxID=2058625 RepID=UPI001331C6D8|nr:hypothetical protein [Undibacterium sp. YM2]BBB66581.1 hypothetical protein UNDYM_2328 [Undibacterium sp. YM2]